MIDSGGEKGRYGPKQLAVGGFEEKAIVVATSKARERRGSGAEHLDHTVSNGLMLACRVGEQLSGATRVGFGPSMHAHRHQASEGGIAYLFAGSNLFDVKAFVVMPCGQTHRGVIRLEGLENDFARGIGTARTARDLGKQLERSLGCAKVRKGEALIG